jgi:type VI secretion system protein VasG
MEEVLCARIRGQDHAMHQVAEILKTVRLEIDPQQPMGVFLLAGSIGRGQTERPCQVVYSVYILKIQSTKHERVSGKHNISRLVGSPPGYVGYGRAVLTEAVL